MRLFLYYASHSFVNQVKKLFRSWVAIVIAASLVFGIVFGLLVGVLAETFEQKKAQTEPTEQVESPMEEPEEEQEPGGWQKLSREEKRSIVGLAVLGFTLLMFLIAALRADKSGSQIFLMADVNLLFTAPMKPQSVLLFRLMSQIFLFLFSGLWMGFQIPNLVMNAHFPLSAALFGIAAWIFIFVYFQLFGVLVYTITATHTKSKRMIRPVVIGCVALLGGSFWAYYSRSGFSVLQAAGRFFNFSGSEWIPVVGWIKGLIVFAMDGEIWKSVACAGLLIVGALLLTWCIWQIKADFYEDAMAGAQIRTEQLEAARKNRFGVFAKKNRERDDKIKRDGLRGSGAQVFFTKTLYNRFRFGILKIFTKTSLFYLAMAILFSIFMIFVLKTPNFWFAGFAFCVVAFFRALGNPLSTDMEKVYFQMVPESFRSKIFWSATGGSVNTALDLLPAFLIVSIFLRSNVAAAVGTFLLALALDFYVGEVLLLLDLSMPTSIAPQAKQAISIMFIYFGLIPPVAILAVAGVFLSLTLAVWIAAAGMTAIGFAVFAICPAILNRGRR